MRKRSLVLFALLLVFWLIISAEVDLQHVLAGTLLSLLTVLFWQDLGSRLPNTPNIKELLRLGYFLALLVGYIIQANIAVAKTLLFSDPPVKPVFMIMEPSIESNWGRVLLATCITITPGTVTVDVDPETGRFIVHALTEKTGIDLLYWRIINEIKKLEACTQRRTEHVVDNGGTNGIGSFGTSTSDYRSNSH